MEVIIWRVCTILRTAFGHVIGSKPQYMYQYTSLSSEGKTSTKLAYPQNRTEKPKTAKEWLHFIWWIHKTDIIK